MAASLPSDFFLPQLALQYMRQGFYESLQTMQNLVGPSSAYPIVMQSDPTMEVSQYVQGPTIARLGTSMVGIRDITSNSIVNPQKFTAVNDQGVKCHRIIGPVEFTYDAARLAGLGNDDGARIAVINAEFGRQAGEYLALSVQKTVIAALKGMVEAVTSSLHTNSLWSSTVKTLLSPGALTDTLNLMGDARDYIIAWIFHTNGVNDLLKDAFGRGLTNVADRALQGNYNTNTIGRNFTYQDDPSLNTSPGGFQKYWTLGVGANVMELYWTLPITLYQPFIATDRMTVTIRWRADADFVLRGHGMKYNDGAGGANPADSVLNTSSNWTPTYTSNKEVRIVECIHNSSSN